MGLHAGKSRVGEGRSEKVGSDSTFSETRSHAQALHEKSSLTLLSLRLGLRLIGGLSEASAQRIVAARNTAPFVHVADLAHRAQLNKHDLGVLAAAGALASLAGHRHAAAWDVAGVEKLPPLLAGAAFDETTARLPAPTEGQDIVADYRALGLTLGRHPLALLRGQLRARRLITSAEVRDTPHGRIVRTAGIVIGRQRPDTASGVMFVTLEDETGATNVIVWRDLSDRQRRELLGARLMGVYSAASNAKASSSICSRDGWWTSPLFLGPCRRARAIFIEWQRAPTTPHLLARVHSPSLSVPAVDIVRRRQGVPMEREAKTAKARPVRRHRPLPGRA